MHTRHQHVCKIKAVKVNHPPNKEIILNIKIIVLQQIQYIIHYARDAQTTNCVLIDEDNGVRIINRFPPFVEAISSANNVNQAKGTRRY